MPLRGDFENAVFPKSVYRIVKRWRITVNQAKIKANDPNPIHVHDTQLEYRVDCADIYIRGPSRIRYMPEPEQDGARVFVETNSRPEIVVQ